MGFIKHILFLLLIPVATYGQTAHVDGDKIVYTGSIKLDNVSKDELYQRAKNAVISNVKGSKKAIAADSNEKGIIAVKGSIKLVSPYHIFKTVEYILELSVEDENYKYRIDKVYVKQVEGGEKTIKISSEQILKSMGVGGPVSAMIEKQLNEIDMNFQKLLALVNAEMKKTPVAKIPEESK